MPKIRKPIGRLIIDTSKMSELGREFAELLKIILDFNERKRHNKNLKMHIPGGRYALLPEEEFEQEIGNRTSRLPFNLQRVLTALWAEEFGVPTFQNWFVTHVWQNPQDRTVLNEIWLRACYEQLFKRTKVYPEFEIDCAADKFIYATRSQHTDRVWCFVQRYPDDQSEFLRNVLPVEALYRHDDDDGWGDM